MLFNCPKCSQTLDCGELQPGQMVQCPKCQQAFNVPPAAEAVPAAEPPPSRQPSVTPKIAIWSLVLGILGMVCCSIFTAIPAVICGHKAQGQIKASNGALGGRSIALAGLILGYVAIGLSVLMIPLQAAIAIPSFMKSRQDSRRSACVNNLRLIDHAKQFLAVESKSMSDDYVPAMSELQPYFKAGGVPVCREGGTYTINCISSAPTCSKCDKPYRHKLMSIDSSESD